MATTYDLHFQLINPDELERRQTGRFFTFGFPRPIGVAGPQKMFNRFIKVFMTGTGSNPLFRKQGTGFTTLIGSNITQVADLQALLQLYIDDASDQLKALDTQATKLDDSERFLSAQITSFNPVSPDGFDALVELKTVSGARVTALIPVSVST